VSDADRIASMTRPGHHGAAESGVTIAEATIAAAWNVQGDPAHAPFAAEAERLFGVALPTAPNTLANSAQLTALWLGPSSRLLIAGSASPLVDFKVTRDALIAVGGALFDVSASRVAWTLSGPRATAVLAKGCPLDFHPRAFAAGACAQSLIGHVNALYVKHDDAPTFTVMVARSYARDTWHSLMTAAAQYGAEVGLPAPYRSAAG
jgi:sarcosine oxidase, subunit gamma